MYDDINYDVDVECCGESRTVFVAKEPLLHELKNGARNCESHSLLETCVWESFFMMPVYSPVNLPTNKRVPEDASLMT